MKMASNGEAEASVNTNDGPRPNNPAMLTPALYALETIHVEAHVEAPTTMLRSPKQTKTKQNVE